MGTQVNEKTKNLSFLKKHAFDINFEVDTTKYRLGAKIGSGAFGVVCDAQQIDSGRRVAIKKIPEALSSLVVMKRTYREICILRHFNHDNVISILDLLLPLNVDPDAARDIYVVLDFMETDLHKLITSEQRLEEDHVRYLMYQLLCGLHYIHSAGVIHRDLKPANLLVNSNCRLRIGDFGMARAISNAADLNTRYKLTQYVMTRWYRAPELLMGQLAYCTAVDLWASGCIMAEMFTRRPLFPGNSEKDQFCQLVEHMGTPSPAFMQKILPHYMKTVIRSFGVKPARPLNHLIPQASRKALDLLNRLLVYEPERRISARQALSHHFLNKYRCPDKEPSCPTPLDFSFDTELVGPDAGRRYRLALLRQARGLHLPQLSDHDYVAESSKGEEKKDVVAQAAIASRIFSPTTEAWTTGGDTQTAEDEEKMKPKLKARKPGGTNWPDKGPLANIAISDHVKQRLLTFLAKPKEKTARRSRRATPYQRRKDVEAKRHRKRKTPTKDQEPNPGGLAVSEDDVKRLERWERLRPQPSTSTATDGELRDSLSHSPPFLDPYSVSGEDEEKLRNLLSDSPPSLNPFSVSGEDEKLRDLLGHTPPSLEPFSVTGDGEEEMQALSAHMDSALQLAHDDPLPSLINTPKGSGTGYGLDPAELEMSEVKNDDADPSLTSNFPSVFEDWNTLLSLFGFETEEANVEEVRQPSDAVDT